MHHARCLKRLLNLGHENVIELLDLYLQCIFSFCLGIPSFHLQVTSSVRRNERKIRRGLVDGCYPYAARYPTKKVDVLWSKVLWAGTQCKMSNLHTTHSVIPQIPAQTLMIKNHQATNMFSVHISHNRTERNAIQCSRPFIFSEISGHQRKSFSPEHAARALDVSILISSAVLPS